MLNPFAVRNIVLVSGERLPVLVVSETGEPLFEPSVYSVAALRATNKAANTIEHVLRSVMLFLLYLRSAEINLDQRFRDGLVLNVSEIDALVALCRKPVSEVVQDTVENSQMFLQRTNPLVLERVRNSPKRQQIPTVCSVTIANRIRDIRAYLGWLVTGYLLRQASGQSSLGASWERCRITLDARVPGKRNRNSIRQREGLPPETLERLFEVTLPDASENPWLQNHVRIRNYLLIRWLSDLGLRRGELLNVKISDIDFRAEQVTITRRPDNPTDPRRRQPLVKTRDRVIPISSELGSLTYSYVTSVRRYLPNARKHDFLIVADRSGKPMSLSALNNVFSEVRGAFPGEFDSLHPHVLRHTWNDRFSEIMDKMRVSPDDEQQMRAFLMGWSPVSKTAFTYTRRHNRNKAQAVSVAMQKRQFKEDNE